MKRFTSRKAIVALVAGLAVAGAGTAVAASGTSSGTSFLDRVAQKLGISSEKLKDATKAAAIDQVDAQLEDGTITQEQADAMKKRIESSDGVGLGGPGFGRHGGFGHRGPGIGGPGPRGPAGHMADVATYLGLTETQLIEQLRAGKTLADVAKAQGKGVDGLKAALLASAKKELAQAVTDGRLTQAQADSALAGTEGRLDDMVNGTFGRGYPGRRHGFGGDDDHGPLGGPRGSLMPGGASLGAPA